MTTLREGDIQIRFSGALAARKFDDPPGHGRLNCMKAVDFLVELQDRLLFIEIKDPEVGGAAPERAGEFVESFLGGKLDEKLKYKYRDSFLYEWALGRARKPIYYLVLVAIEQLSDAELLARTDELGRKLPFRGPHGEEWVRTFVTGCAVLNLRTWNRTFTQYPARRLS